MADKGPNPKAGGKDEPERLMNDVTEMAGVNLEEEQSLIIGNDDIVQGGFDRRSRDDLTYTDNFINMRILETKVADTAYKRKLDTVDSDVCLYLVYAAHTYMRNALEDLCRVKTHRVDQKDDNLPYKVESDPRSQLKALERLERAAVNRKAEQEKELLLRQAKSRSKAMEKNPDAAAIKQKAKQLKQDEETRNRRLLSNSAALGAIRGSKNKKSWMSAGSTPSPLASAKVANSPVVSLATPTLQAKRDMVAIASLNSKRNRGEPLSVMEASHLKKLVERRDSILTEHRSQGTVTPNGKSHPLSRKPSMLTRQGQRITLKDLIFYIENSSKLCKSRAALKAHGKYHDASQALVVQQHEQQSSHQQHQQQHQTQ